MLIAHFFVLFCAAKPEKYGVDGGAVGVVDSIIDPMDFSRSLFLCTQPIRWTSGHLWKMDAGYCR